MSFASFLGLDKAGEQSIEEAHKALNENIDKLDPLFQRALGYINGMLNGLLDRLNGTTFVITVKIPPVPRAEPVDPQ